VLGGDSVVTAAQLAAADVVLTTYDVLRKDVAAQPGVEGESRAMRRAKRWGRERFVQCVKCGVGVCSVWCGMGKGGRGGA
jgi:hypothetical protein